VRQAEKVQQKNTGSNIVMMVMTAAEKEEQDFLSINQQQ